MIDDYQGKNIDETVQSIDDFGASALQQFLVFEREHKNRQGVIEWIRDELVTIEAPEGGYYAGLWFDSAGERVVRDNHTVRRALDETELEAVE
jgi:hypothetical protein